MGDSCGMYYMRTSSLPSTRRRKAAPLAPPPPPPPPPPPALLPPALLPREPMCTRSCSAVRQTLMTPTVRLTGMPDGESSGAGSEEKPLPWRGGRRRGAMGGAMGWGDGWGDWVMGGAMGRWGRVVGRWVGRWGDASRSSRTRQERRALERAVGMPDGVWGVPGGCWTCPEGVGRDGRGVDVSGGCGA